MPDGTFVEMERIGKRYYLNYELSGPTASADTSAKLVAPNAVEEGRAEAERSRYVIQKYGMCYIGGHDGIGNSSQWR